MYYSTFPMLFFYISKKSVRRTLPGLGTIHFPSVIVWVWNKIICSQKRAYYAIPHKHSNPMLNRDNKDIKYQRFHKASDQWSIDIGFPYKN